MPPYVPTASSLGGSFSRPRRAVRALLDLGFALLCLRFLYAAGRIADWTFVMLCLVSFGAACWRPSTSLFVPILGFSLLSGLNLTILPVAYSLLLAVGSSIWLGRFLGKALRPRLGMGPVGPDGDGNRPNRLADHLMEALTLVALVHIFVQAWQNRSAPDFWTHFWQTAYATGDVFYFLTSGFLWLHGLFYFRALRDDPESEVLTPTGIKLVFHVNSVVLIFFFAVQWKLGFPFHWTPGFQSPYEDIATFGIIAACLFFAAINLFRWNLSPRSFFLGLSTFLLTLAISASWSRGTWLATLTGLSVLALLRLPLRLGILFLALLLGAVVMFNLNAQRIESLGQLPLNRLLQLVRVEKLQAKSSGRLEQYYKGFAMIRERPLTGHGIGTFSRKAVSFAKADDPYPGQYLPHNIALQLATEQGLPVTVLFLSLVGWMLWRGVRCWTHHRRSKYPPGEAEIQRQAATLVLILTLALGAYFQANLTWDILTVHPSQPFFFWFLMAALWTTTERALDHQNAQTQSSGV